jgi:hypothetical protein
MLEAIIAVLIGLLGGVAVGVQSPLSGIVSEKVGGVNLSSNFYNTAPKNVVQLYRFQLPFGDALN